MTCHSHLSPHRIVAVGPAFALLPVHGRCLRARRPCWTCRRNSGTEPWLTLFGNMKLPWRHWRSVASQLPWLLRRRVRRPRRPQLHNIVQHHLLTTLTTHAPLEVPAAFLHLHPAQHSTCNSCRRSTHTHSRTPFRRCRCVESLLRTYLARRVRPIGLVLRRIAPLVRSVAHRRSALASLHLLWRRDAHAATDLRRALGGPLQGKALAPFLRRRLSALGRSHSPTDRAAFLDLVA